jgi:hypothetical protein
VGGFRSGLNLSDSSDSFTVAVSQASNFLMFHDGITGAFFHTISELNVIANIAGIESSRSKHPVSLLFSPDGKYALLGSTSMNLSLSI